MCDQESQDLQQAKVRAILATELKAKFTVLLQEINKEFPPNTFNLTKTQKTKALGIDKALDRLMRAIMLPDIIQERIAFENRKKEKILKEEKIKQLEEEALKEHIELRNKAIQLVLSHGLKFGIDFTVENAIDAANNLVFESEKIRAIENIASGNFISFEGQNCENCSGWDGVSQRCECGNRRIDWSFEGNFNDMVVFGEAF